VIDIEAPRSKRCDGKYISQTGMTLKHCSEADSQTGGRVNGQNTVYNADTVSYRKKLQDLVLTNECKIYNFAKEFGKEVPFSGFGVK